MSCMDNSLLKYSAKDHFFRAAVCHLCVDTLNAEQALARYEELFPQFADSRECKLLKVSLSIVDLKPVCKINLRDYKKNHT